MAKELKDLEQHKLIGKIVTNAQPSGSECVVISKLSFIGQRVWSTYLGGTESDEFSSLDVNGGMILISGGTLSQNIASANSFLNIKPNLSVPDIFFAIFNTWWSL